ncbi:carbohydrate esterase family 1 protein [Zopfia rhizophila CBS 207.26]|uniref:Feruloyl esterase C n=1 Tax=Zopfia rhizophila CBS 207.26 TaxID=1314779 RepID=A0A6A6EKX2_9PEZI|nr:carbohydrate esterase family 1 protein [Zopfia rhizophila CBS 207.26]
MPRQHSCLASFALVLLAVVSAVFAGSVGCGKTPTLKSGTYNATVNNKNRQYILKIPDNYDSSKPYKLIFGLHWLTGTVEKDVWAYYGLQRLANNSAIFIAPQGLNNGWANTGGEDITFIDTIIKTVEADLCVNEKLRFSTGFSYGAAMSYSLACSRPDIFRAVAVLSGGLLSGCDGGTKPVAFYGQHGISDQVLTVAGGRQLRDTFVKANGCTAGNAATVTKGSKTHAKTVYSGCSSGHPVVWVEFDEGHIPAPQDGATGTSGSKTWTPAETWEFFSQFT